MPKMCLRMWAVVWFPRSQTCSISLLYGSSLFSYTHWNPWLFPGRIRITSYFRCSLLVASAQYLFNHATQWIFPVQLISGAIPGFLGKLTNLTNLNLVGNGLTGEINNRTLTGIFRCSKSVHYFPFHMHSPRRNRPVVIWSSNPMHFSRATDFRRDSCVPWPTEKLEEAVSPYQ